jgi:hypothetical protein
MKLAIKVFLVTFVLLGSGEVAFRLLGDPWGSYYVIALVVAGIVTGFDYSLRHG